MDDNPVTQPVQTPRATVPRPTPPTVDLSDLPNDPYDMIGQRRGYTVVGLLMIAVIVFQHRLAMSLALAFNAAIWLSVAWAASLDIRRMAAQGKGKPQAAPSPDHITRRPRMKK